VACGAESPLYQSGPYHAPAHFPPELSRAYEFVGETQRPATYRGVGQSRTATNSMWGLIFRHVSGKLLGHVLPLK
jgi:hypothetical protein